ncbi:MAG: hypothetical protein KGZ25_13715 [Planctomycetes bacterium]|nr:hypothetical protein [Planctomycetota bacterium]
MDIEEHNLSEIQRTNQRGGHCLSVIDLIQDNTLTASMAALSWNLIEGGTSYLTGAVPGGAGKTTLLAGLLAFLPPGERIVTASEPEVVRRAVNGKLENPYCLLAHEIGQGPWFAYIWGETARRFFAARGEGCRRVTCLHADDPRQTESILRDCGVAQEDISGIEMELFIRIFGGTRRMHRVTSIFYRFGDTMEQIYEWQKGDDHFEQHMETNELSERIAQQLGVSGGDFHDKWEDRTQFLASLSENEVRDFGKVRQAILEMY